MKGKILMMLLVAMAAAVAGQAFAQGGQEGEVIDRVIAVVEDRALLQSEFDMEYRRLLMQLQKESLPPEEEKANRREILDALIGNLLMAVHAEKIGVEVTDEQIDTQVERTLEQNMRAMGGAEAFNRELQKAGMTLDQLKDTWRESIRAMRLVEELRYREVYSGIKVTEDEIRDYYREHLGDLPKRPSTVSLAQILIMMKATGEAEQSALARIREIKKLIDEGADFATTAQEYSEGPSAKYGGSLGYMKLEDFGNPAFEDAVRKLIVGEVSEPVLTEHGYHIIKLEEVSGDEVKLRHILVRREIDEEATRTFAEGIRRQILDGADFAEMARTYSEDPETRDDGGDVGEIPLPNLPEFFQKAIAGVADGEIAPLIEDSKGFRIIKVLGRNEGRPYTLEEARSGIKELIERERAVEKSDEYIAGLRDIYYVDVKIEI
ncbi:MAG TPA: peptidylprolyl isomerase [Candidatus Krumholzibacterium sp.]|nr:peptidylprolyl isomerase [Candidatus Krumholzibacterium sp.]